MLLDTVESFKCNGKEKKSYWLQTEVLLKSWHCCSFCKPYGQNYGLVAAVHILN